MVPAHQRLGSHDPSRLEAYLGLEEQIKLASPQGLAQIAVEPALAVENILVGRAETANADIVLAGLDKGDLGLVEKGYSCLVAARITCLNLDMQVMPFYPI